MASKLKKINKPIISPYKLIDNKTNMKLIELVNSVEALNKLSETKLPASVAFSLGKFLKEITSDVETYNKVRGEKVVEYGTETGEVDEKGNKRYSFDTEIGKKFVEEMTEIENKELDVKIPDIKIADLGSVVIEPKHLVALSWLIKEN